MLWFFAVAERDHFIQNPTSPEKIRRLGELLHLRPASRLVDIACGKGGPAIVFARGVRLSHRGRRASAGVRPGRQGAKSLKPAWWS